MFDLPAETARGLRALKALARGDGHLTAADLAREARVAPSHAARLMRTLKGAGLVVSSGSGWSLARPAGVISVLEAVEALGMSRPRSEGCPHCDDRDGCVLAPLCREAHEAMIELFRTHSLADLRAEIPALP
jgi:Rrf2 family protein